MLNPVVFILYFPGIKEERLVLYYVSPERIKQGN